MTENFEFPEDPNIAFFPSDNAPSLSKIYSIWAKLMANEMNELADALLSVEKNTGLDNKTSINYTTLAKSLRALGYEDEADAWEYELRFFPDSESKTPNNPLLNRLKIELDYSETYSEYAKIIDEWIEAGYCDSIAYLPQILRTLDHGLAANLWKDLIFEYKENSFYPQKYGNEVGDNFFAKLLSVLGAFGPKYDEYSRLVSSWSPSNFDREKLYEILNAVDYRDAAKAWDKPVELARDSFAEAAKDASAIDEYDATRRPDAGIFNAQEFVLADIQSALAEDTPKADHGFERRGTETRHIDDPGQRHGILEKLGKFFRRK